MMKFVIEGMTTHIQEIQLRVFNGEINALEAYIELRTLADVLAASVEAIKADAVADAQRRKGEIYHGKLISFSEGRRTFDYSGIPDIVTAQASLEALKERHKNAALQMEKGMKAVDDETGELIQPAIVKYGEPVIALKTPKQ